MDNNNKKIFIMIISLALVVITGTFAWLSWRSQNTAMVLTIGDIRGLTVTLKPYQINSSLSPVSSYTDGIAIDVTADNKKTEPDNFKLYYKIATIDSALIDSGFKYTIARCSVDCDNANNYSVLSDAEGSFASAASNSKLDIYQATVPANTTYKYKVYLWIDSSSGNQSNMQNKSFVGELRAIASVSPYAIMKDNAVMDNIKSTYVSATTGVNFNAVSSNTNGKGIYIRAGTENDAHPIYYYRGAVTDNNVLFAGFCWKIVRTTSTGGTKLVYNGPPTGTNNDQCGNTTESTTIIGNSVFNTYDTSLADVGYMYGTRYVRTYKKMTNINDVYMYGTGYDETNHKLVTTGAMNFAGTDWGTYYNQMSNNHYTCFNTSGECTTYYYIFYTGSTECGYIKLANGKSVEDAMAEMFTNTSNSKLKTVLDTWYSSNMTSYTNKIEDTPYCNDRSIYQMNGWNPSGQTTLNRLLFSAYERTYITHNPNLTCNINDAFTVDASNGNGKLTYPIGFLTADELMLAGGKSTTENSTYYLYNNQSWWLGTPQTFERSWTSGYVFWKSGSISGNMSDGGIRIGNTGVVRPVISLKPDTKLRSGIGTATNPYVVE